MSTISKLAVPATSISLNTDVPTAVILSLNVAAPAADISRVSAVIIDPPSLPCNKMSLSETEEATIKLLLLFASLPNWVPSSFNRMSPPPASRVISPGASMVTSVFPELSSAMIVSKAIDPT